MVTVLEVDHPSDHSYEIIVPRLWLKEICWK